MKSFKWFVVVLIAGVCLAVPAGRLLDAQCEGGGCDQMKKAMEEMNAKFKDFVGKTPAELTAEKADWNNSQEALTLGALKNRVVYLEFGVAQCPMCQEQINTLNAWQKKYSEAGLSVLAVRPALNSNEDIQTQIKNKKIGYPVLRDACGKNAEAYGFSMMPVAFIIAPDEKGEQVITWAGCPCGSRADIEKVITAELTKLASKRK